MRIGIAYSLAPVDGSHDGPDDRFEEFDKPETVDALAEVIRGEGHDVAYLGDGRALIESVLSDPPDFVFNIAEGQGTSRNREARVPAFLETLGIPYSGSDALTLSATLDKEVAKRLVTGVRALRVPAGLALPPDLSRNEVIHEITTGLYPLAGGQVPLILKPTFEGSSKGIRGNCLADSPEEAAETFGRLAEAYRQPILVEQFIQGDEVTVGLVGNGTSVEILGALRVIPRVATDRFVYSLEVKRDWTRLVDYEAPARLPEPVRNTLFEAARGAWQALGCRDLARIDFRIGPDGVPDFIEANPLPGLSPTTSDLVILARGHGLSYEDLIRKILHAALSRVDLRQREPVAS